jgi:hypothetical protein
VSQHHESLQAHVEATTVLAQREARLHLEHGQRRAVRVVELHAMQPPIVFGEPLVGEHAGACGVLVPVALEPLVRALARRRAPLVRFLERQDRLEEARVLAPPGVTHDARTGEIGVDRGSAQAAELEEGPRERVVGQRSVRAELRCAPGKRRRLARAIEQQRERRAQLQHLGVRRLAREGRVGLSGDGAVLAIERPGRELDGGFAEERPRLECVA